MCQVRQLSAGFPSTPGSLIAVVCPRRRLLPANVVVRAFEFIPPQATLQLRSLMAMASAQGHKAAQLVAEALPAEVMETLSTALKGANFTK